MTPEVSIIIANYNNAAYLPEAIDSILAQEGVGEMEIIVVDDASTDDTPRVLEAYRDRIVACLLPANRRRRGAQH
jgi:glycosyltransferase involved in cell wall biosynthesis